MHTAMHDDSSEYTHISGVEPSGAQWQLLRSDRSGAHTLLQVVAVEEALRLELKRAPTLPQRSHKRKRLGGASEANASSRAKTTTEGK